MPAATPRVVMAMFMKKLIYVVKSEAGPIKIGIAAHARGRLSTLRSGSFSRLTLEWSAETERAIELEAVAHGLLAAHRIRGEWFSVDAKTAIDVVVTAAARIGCSLIQPKPKPQLRWHKPRVFDENWRNIYPG